MCRGSQRDGASSTLALIGQTLFGAAFNSLWILFALVVVNPMVRRVSITAIIMIGFLMLTGASSIAEAPPIWLGVLVSLVSLTAIVLVVLRFGLLAMLTFFTSNFLLHSTAPTMDTSKWFFSNSLMLLLTVAGLGVYGFMRPAAGNPCWGSGYSISHS